MSNVLDVTEQWALRVLIYLLRRHGHEPQIEQASAVSKHGNLDGSPCVKIGADMHRSRHC
jgi:hypothetical protein